MSLIRYVASNVYTLKKVCSLKNSNKYMNMACLDKAMSNLSLILPNFWIQPRQKTETMSPTQSKVTFRC